MRLSYIRSYNISMKQTFVCISEGKDEGRNCSKADEGTHL